MTYFLLTFLFHIQFAHAEIASDGWGEELPKSCDAYKYEHYFVSVGKSCCPNYRAEPRGDTVICWRRDVTPPAGPAASSASPAVKSPTALGEACREKVDTTTKDCKFDNNNTVQTTKMAIDMLNAKLKQSAMSNPAQLCGEMGAMAQSIDGASGAFNTYCSNSIYQCQSTCEEDIEQLEKTSAATKDPAHAEALTAAKANLKKCGSLTANLTSVKNNIDGYSQIEQAKSQYCKAQVNPMDAFCKANPGFAMCKGIGSTNCADAQTASTNPICFCNTNPNDSRCPTANNSNFAGQGKATDISGLGDPTSGANGDFGGPGGGMGDFVPSEMEGAAGKPAGGNLNQGNAGRNGLDVGGSGTGQGPNKGGAAAGGAGLNTKTIGGYGFGGGGGAPGSGSRGSGPGGSGGYAGPGGNNARNVDLRQFLPGGALDPKRALAGNSGPDGITGPHSNIWAKVRVRYHSVQPTLLP